jgi:hypothetical protein
MLKNAVSNGHSSKVRGWLLVCGVQYELAQVGPDFCIVRGRLSLQVLSESEMQAELVIEVDGDQRRVAILLRSTHILSSQKLHFQRVSAV